MYTNKLYLKKRVHDRDNVIFQYVISSDLKSVLSTKELYLKTLSLLKILKSHSVIF